MTKQKTKSIKMSSNDCIIECMLHTTINSYTFKYGMVKFTWIANERDLDAMSVNF